MKIPKKLKIGGHIYKVVFQKTALGDDCGATERAKGIINIDGHLIDSEKEVTLFHEIFHCINAELPETEVDWLAQSVYAFLKLNNMLK